MFRRVHVIINPASGRDRPILSMLNDVFQPAGVDWDVFITKTDGDARRLGEEAVKAGADAVAVYGGDGTVTEVAAGMAGSEVPLAILPGGTANAVALAVGVPMDPAAAAALLTDAPCTLRTVDLGQLGDRHFLIAVGIGIPGALAEAADRESKDRLGVLAYALGSIQALRSAQVAKYEMELDGKRVDREGVMCVVANSGNFGVPGLSLAPTIDMGDGLLDVLVFQSADLSSILSTAASVVRQNEDTAPFERWQARDITIRTNPPQAIQADGEVLEPGDISARIMAGAVRLLVPESAEKPEKAELS